MSNKRGGLRVNGGGWKNRNLTSRRADIYSDNITHLLLTV